MKAWLTHHLVVWLVRGVVTLAACMTIQRITEAEGYRLDLGDILIAAACIIVGVRVWMPWTRDT